MKMKVTELWRTHLYWSFSCSPATREKSRRGAHIFSPVSPSRKWATDLWKSCVFRDCWELTPGTIIRRIPGFLQNLSSHKFQKFTSF
jgi:hypothetical protein